MISANGYDALPEYPNARLEKWIIPTKTGEYRHVILRNGHLGFLLTWVVLWFHENIEPVNKGVWDEWGWAYRNIRGSTYAMSNHASGTAVDINATLHPLGKRNTFKYAWHMLGIRWMLARYLKFTVKWGGDYENRADEMHFEIDATPGRCTRVAKRLQKTQLGKRILRANKHYQIYNS